MEQNPSWEANSRSANQTILHLLRKAKVHYHVSILHRLNTTSFFTEIHFYDDMFQIFWIHLQVTYHVVDYVITMLLFVGYPLDNYKKLKVVIENDKN
jgi:hypothetical protein